MQFGPLRAPPMHVLMIPATAIFGGSHVIFVVFAS